MKPLVFALLLILVSVVTHANEPLRAPAKLVSLSACQTRTLNIELNVANRTPKAQLVDALKLLAAYRNFSFTPVFSIQDEITIRAVLHDTCVSDSCARDLGWFDLQSRLARYRGVQISCELPVSAPARNAPRAPAPMPMPGQQPGPGQPPPPPGKGGVTGGN